MTTSAGYPSVNLKKVEEALNGHFNYFPFEVNAIRTKSNRHILISNQKF